MIRFITSHNQRENGKRFLNLICSEMTCQEHVTGNQEINLLFIFGKQVDYKWLQKDGQF